MSWLTDPDEEWSTDTPSRGRGPAADPADYPTAPNRPVRSAAEPPPPAGAPRPPAGYRDTRNEPPSGYSAQGAAGYPTPGERPAQPGGRPGYSAVPDGLWAGEGAPREDPDDGWHEFADYGEEPPRRSRLGVVAAIVVAWLVVSIAVLGFLLLFRGGPKSNHTAATSAGTTAAPSTTGGAPAPKPSAAALPAGWVKQASDSQTDCAAHSYGQVQGFLGKTPCSSVQRLLATTTQNGRQVIIASYVIHFATPGQAASFNSLVTTDGTGDITNLLTEGNRIPGGPSTLPDAAFASRQSGNAVSVPEAAYAVGSSHGSDPTLKSVANQGIAG